MAEVNPTYKRVHLYWLVIRNMDKRPRTEVDVEGRRYFVWCVGKNTFCWLSVELLPQFLQGEAAVDARRKLADWFGIDSPTGEVVPEIDKISEPVMKRIEQMQLKFRDSAEYLGLSGSNLRLAQSAFDRTLAVMLRGRLIKGT